MRVCVLVMLAAAACGGGGDRAPANVRATGPTTIVAPQHGAEDIVVATVDGRPVWASCVKAQAAARKLTEDKALAECIDFELLAGAAHARTFERDPDVQEAARAAMVNRLVELDVEGRLDEPDTVRPLLEAQLDRLQARFDQPETRDSSFIRVEVPPNSPEPVWTEAKQVVDKMYAELDGETGLFISHLQDVAARARSSTKLKIAVEPFRFERIERLVPEYGRPLFAIPDVGRVAPPARTRWGWDIILLTGLRPAKRYTRDEVAVDILPEARRAYFKRWVEQIVRPYGTVEIDDAQLQQLEGL